MRKGLMVAALAVLGVAAVAQEKEDRTLLTPEQMNAIINEASGERAMHHLMQLVPYQFVRPPSEYQGHFRESEVMARLAKDRIPLTVCPLSNLKLCVFPDLAAHNLRELLDAGLVATVNSDDPAYFGGYMNDNFVAAFEALPLDLSHARQLARNSFAAAFVGPEQKRAFLAEVDQFFAGT